MVDENSNILDRHIADRTPLAIHSQRSHRTLIARHCLSFDHCVRGVLVPPTY